MKIIIAQSIPAQARALESMLRKHGCEALASASGEEALRRIKDDLTVRGALFDAVMPGIDALALSAELHSEGKSIPFVVTAVAGELEHAQRTFAFGCRGVMPKPLTEEDVVQAITLLGARLLAPTGMPVMMPSRGAPLWQGATL